MSRTKAVVHAVRSYIRRAPGTFTWLAILLVTTVVLAHLSPEDTRVVLGNRSTNLHHLREDPVRVLITSAFWLPGGGWLWYVVLYNIFHVPAERWLGTLRWLAVVVTAHVGATYLSQGVLYWAIRHGHAPTQAVFTLDVGVSYALAGIMAVLTYRIGRPWCFVYSAAVVIYYAVPLFESLTFTDIGHFTAMLIGFACYPLTRDRPGPRTPPAATSLLRRRHSRSKENS